MSDNIRAMFVGQEAADAEAENTKRAYEHAAKMSAYREQRANAINILVGTLVFVLCILVLVGGFCAAVLLVRAVF